MELVEVKSIIYSDFYKNAILAFVHEEASKVLNKWKIVEYNLFLDLPRVVNDILHDYPNLYLSGSALMTDTPSDYDFFIVGNENNVLNEFREKYETTENNYCLNFRTDDRHDIQIIKRVYKTPELIIAGFDLSIIRSFYRPGKYCTSILNLFERKHDRLFINMKNNSKAYSSRIMKYREYMLSFCVFDKRFIKSRKEKSYFQKRNRRLHSTVNYIIKGKFHKVYLHKGIIESEESYFKNNINETGNFYQIFNADIKSGTFTHNNTEYYFKHEDTLEIVKKLFREGIANLKKTLLPVYIDRFTSPIFPLPASYVLHRNINVFTAFPFMMFVLKFKLPRYIKIMIIWYITIDLMDININDNFTPILKKYFEVM